MYLPKIHEYKSTRNEMSGFDNSTKFSAYLAIGCISPRRIYHEIKIQEEKTYKSDSSYWIYFELLWRDFFYLVMKYSENKLFLKSGIKEINYNFRKDEKSLKNFFNASTELMKVMARACGHDHLNQFNLSDLTTWKKEISELAGIEYGGIR